MSKVQCMLVAIGAFCLAVIIPTVMHAQGGGAAIELLQPLGNNSVIPVQSGIGTLVMYFNDSIGWVLDVATGIAVFWVVIAGFEIMLSGGSGRFSNLKDSGIQHMQWAIIGLLILLFSGLILRQLNSLFYT